MSLKFSVDVSGMDEVKRQFARACDRAESALAQQVMKDTIPFVPALTGSLTQRTRVVGNEVIYPGPYARFLYYGKVMVDPNINAAGFLTKDGTWRSRKGAAKVLTDRNLTYDTSKNADAGPYWDRRLVAAEGDAMAQEIREYIRRREALK